MKNQKRRTQFHSNNCTVAKLALAIVGLLNTSKVKAKIEIKGIIFSSAM